MSCEKCEPDNFYYENGSAVCTVCGKMHSNMLQLVVGIDTYNDTLQVCFYQRKKRFEQILDKITNPCMESKDIAVYKLLSVSRFRTVEDLIKRMKSLKVKDKRYHSLHLFAKFFMTTYVPPTPIHQREKDMCMVMFSQIETMFLRHFDVPFFNYAWLIRKILHEHGQYQFDKYIKKIKCTKRNMYYENMFNDLYTKIQAQDGVGSCP